MKIVVHEYIGDDGINAYKQWFDELDATAAGKVSVAVARIEAGNTSNIKWFRGIGEYVIDWGPGYRVYLAKDGESLIILFGGSSKKTQQKAIESAIFLHAEFKIKKKAALAKLRKLKCR